MDSFEEWVKAADYPCFHDWGEKALELGASWDTFHRSDKDTIVADLARGGIPLIAARDMTEIASAEVKRKEVPMAVFWDLENMPIPTETSGREITSSLKSILAPHGDLVQFRGYASIGLNQIPQEKRSDLQLSGCHLVDCPHHGRKEVADKMIIVDAMQFAFQHPDGATLCFITGDVDYAYLLATLQRPQWRTIVISRGTMQSMLHVNCDMKMRWETDILQPIYGVSIEKNRTEISNESEEESTDPSFASLFKPLTAAEEWDDDIELLRMIIKQECQKRGVIAARKSLIGNLLRSTNPARFPEREAIKAFLAAAIDKGVVFEQGDGAFKTLCLPLHRNSAIQSSVSLSKTVPDFLDSWPQNIKEIVKVSPFAVVLPKVACPTGSTKPDKAFIQSTTNCLFYFFSTQNRALNAVQEHDWLRLGALIDARGVPSNAEPGEPLLASQEMQKCTVCNTLVPSSSFQFGVGSTRTCSLLCKEWLETGAAERERGVELVVETMEFLASYDDVSCHPNIVRKLVAERHPEECTSRKLAKLWLLEAEQSMVVITHSHMKNKFTSLAAFASEEMDLGLHANTDAEEAFVFDLLFEHESGIIDRKIVNQLLAKKFTATMQTAKSRNQVYNNARAKEKFFLGKSCHQQLVGLNKNQVEAAVQVSMGSIQQDTTTETSFFDGGELNCSNIDSGEDNSSDDDSSDEEDLMLLVNPPF